MSLSAIIFDMDGTLADTEEAHRHAFLMAFRQMGLNWRWDQELYRELLAVSGGRERILAYDPDASPELVAALHQRKTEIYTDMVNSGRMVLRPGVEALIHQAKAEGIRLAIASTTSRANVEALLGSRLPWFDLVACGEDVARKKPDPQVYQLVLFRLGLNPEDCIAIEDSPNGVRAAVDAGLKVVVTESTYTVGDTFTGAAAVYPDLSQVSLDTLRTILG